MENPREAFVIALRCPHCQTGGEAVLAFDPAGAETVAGLSVRSASRGFHVAKLGPTVVATEFRCDHCDEVAG